MGAQDILNAVTQTICWTVIFFFASAGASSAYLTVSEVFPLETRAMAIAFFYAIGTAAGGVSAPLLFSVLIAAGRTQAFFGDLLGAALMIAGGVVAIFFGVDAERKGLEQIARPLSFEEEEGLGSAASPA